MLQLRSTLISKWNLTKTVTPHNHPNNVRHFCTKNIPLNGVVVGCYTDGTLTDIGNRIDQASKGNLKKKLALVDLKKFKKVGTSCVLFDVDESFPRVAVVSLGQKSGTNDGHDKKEESWDSDGSPDWNEQVRKVAASGVSSLKKAGATVIGLESFGTNFEPVAEGGVLNLYKYEKPKSPNGKEEEDAKVEIFPLSIENGKPSTASNVSWTNGTIAASAQNLARDWMNTPANLMTPSIFVDKAKQALSGLANTEVLIRDTNWIEQKKMGCFLGVTRGSDEPPKFLEVHYRGKHDSQPLVLVGKGVTFDTGGISLKPSKDMHHMKGDMGGAASVVCALLAISKLKLPINVSCLVPLCENMPSGRATKPGDLLTAMNGKTVEVGNTDAEGRLILADALHYAHSFNPHTIVDVATLTGAIVVALGYAAAGVFTNSLKVWQELEEASAKTGELMWRMPLYKQYKKQMESDVADLNNLSNIAAAGSCSAAIFLKEFVTSPRWAHLDIAGVSNIPSESGCLAKGMTGIPVRTLVQFASLASTNAAKSGP